MSLTVMQGDCLKVMRRMPGDSIDAIVTDPPYGVDLRYASHDDSQDKYFSLIESFMSEAQRVVSADGLIMLTPGMKHLAWWYQQFPPKWTAAWFKPNQCSRNALGGFSAWEPVLIWGTAKRFKLRRDAIHKSITRQPDTGNHPCPKNADAWRLIMELIKWPEGATVLDPFMGSGTTGIVCQQMGLSFIGIEKDAQYFKTAKRRIAEALQERRAA